MRLFRRTPLRSVNDAVEHAVVTHLPLGGGSDEERAAVQALEERIQDAVAAIGGEHDGEEFRDGQAILYTYGPDADALLDAIRPCLDGFPVRPGAYAVKRYGAARDPRAGESREPLT